MNKLVTLLFPTILLVACQPNAEQQAAKEKALIDSTASATASRVAKEFESKNQSTPDQSQSTGSNSPIENTKSYKWEGDYSGGDDNVSYSLKVTTWGPLRWTEFGWEMEASGIQTYYKISGYAIRDDQGNLEFHYMEQADGAFYQADEMDMNSIMFKLKKKGNSYIAINGKWKITDFITDFDKK
ncbi:MAG: DUF5991 domain-containing protein [Candidatus Pollutiaquabacter aromativorans]